MTLFNSFGFPETIAQAITAMHFENATPIQAQAIPPALLGKDILGTAQTGTGKTAAFGLPLLTHLINNPDSVGLILCPTRELATQVMAAMRDFMKFTSGIRCALLLGGNPMPMQLDQLKRRPRLIIGTPGRVNDHLRRNKHILSHADFVVLDEADRMLDMGFTPQLDTILEHVPAQRQNLMFSATMDKKTEKFTQQYLNNPVRIAVEAKKVTADNINHDIIHTTAQHKYEALLKELETRSGSIIIFVKTRRNADKIAADLCRKGHEAEPIHGDLRQRQRDRAIRGFRDMKYRVMVATDVAARGLDIPHIEHVINYDLPQCPEDYIHRIGRTARAGAKGNAMAFICPSDRGQWSAINRLINPNAAVNDDARDAYSRSHSRGGKRPFAKPGNKATGNSRFHNKRSDDSRDFSKKRDFNDNNQRFDDRKPRGEKRDFNDDSRSNDRKPYAPKRDFNDDNRSGEKKPFRQKRDFNDTNRSEERKPYAKKRDFNDGERSSERKPYAPKRDFNDDNRSNDRKPYAKKRDFNDGERTGERSNDRKPYGEKPRYDRDSTKPAYKKRSASNTSSSVKNDNGTFRMQAPAGSPVTIDELKAKKKKKMGTKTKEFKFKAHSRKS